MDDFQSSIIFQAREANAVENHVSEAAVTQLSVERDAF